MSLYALGLNHQTAPLAIRERVVFHVERLREALTELRRTLAHEAAILSTCNRTELYVAGEEPAAIAQWLACSLGQLVELLGQASPVGLESSAP